jgi:hypothetical protein
MDIYQIHQKHCNKCNTTKSIDQFSKDNSQKSGYRSNCKVCCSISKKLYNQREDIKQKQKQKSKLYYQENRDIIRKKSKIYEQNNRDKINTRRKERRNTDPLYRLSENIRAMIRKTLLRNKQTYATTDIIGCSFEEFKLHIEQQFIAGMTWENRSEWHLDHIIPISSAHTVDDIIRLNHYTNLRPLWAIDNLKKSNKLI